MFKDGEKFLDQTYFQQKKKHLSHDWLDKEKQFKFLCCSFFSVSNIQICDFVLHFSEVQKNACLLLPKIPISDFHHQQYQKHQECYLIGMLYSGVQNLSTIVITQNSKYFAYSTFLSVYAYDQSTLESVNIITIKSIVKTISFWYWVKLWPRKNRKFVVKR